MKIGGLLISCAASLLVAASLSWFFLLCVYVVILLILEREPEGPLYLSSDHASAVGLLVRVIAGAHQRPGLHVAEAHLQRLLLEEAELLGRI